MAKNSAATGIPFGHNWRGCRHCRRRRHVFMSGFPVRDDKLVVMKGKVGGKGGKVGEAILAHFAHRVVAQRVWRA